MTAPADTTWRATDGRFRRFETSRLIGMPDAEWERVSRDLLRRTANGVELTIRSLTRPARSVFWRAAYPLLRIAQSIARRRYLRALS